MSLKAKDLHFDSSQPAFLQRLRGQLTGNGDAARHEQPIQRNKRLKKDDEEDAPTYVMEDTNQSLTKAEYDALVAGKTDAENEKKNTSEAAVTEGDLTTKNISRSKDKIAELGANAKKRKVAKVIGDEHSEKEHIEKPNPKPTKKIKKKSKAVKLTFDDEPEV